MLVVDASQGVEAQTLANTATWRWTTTWKLVPILNKIDLPSAEPGPPWPTRSEDVIGLPCMDAPRVSAKLGVGVQDVLERVVADVPAPTGDPDAAAESADLRLHLRQLQGRHRLSARLRRPPSSRGRAPCRLMQHGRAVPRPWRSATWARPQLAPCGTLEAGEVGYLTASPSRRCARHPRRRHRHACVRLPDGRAAARLSAP